MNSLSQAYEECRLLNKYYGTPFGQALPLFPKETQLHLHALFAYDRLSREMLYRPNKGIKESEQLHALQNWKEALLDGVQTSYSPNRYLQALIHTKQLFDLPEKPLAQIIDLRKARFLLGQFESESHYEKHKKQFLAAFLLLLSPLLEMRDRQTKKAITILLNNGEQLESFHWLKKSEKRHLFFSKSLMKEMGYTRQHLLEQEVNAPWRQLLERVLVDMEKELAWTQKHLPEFPERLQLALQTTIEVQGAYIDAIRKKDYDLFTRQPRLAFSTKLRHAIPRLQSLLR